VGGWCRSIVQDGFTFDYAGHIMFSNDPYVHELYRLLLGDNVHWQDREAFIFSKGVHTRYPFQGSLYGLPPAVIKECLLGAIETRYATTAAPRVNGRKPGNTHCTISVSDCCADGVLDATAPLVDRADEADNFRDFIFRVWGRGIAEHFAIPYNQKLWAVPLEEMETSWLGGRVPMPDLEEMLDGALKATPKPMGPNARFGYVLRGGFQALMDAFLPHLRGDLRLRSRVVSVSPRRHRLITSDGVHAEYDALISTMPLPLLIHAIGSEAPTDIQEAAAGLRHVSVRCVHLGIGREALTDKHWIYYPEDPVFHRIFVQGNASPYCNPPGGFGLTCEITYSPSKPLPCEGDELIARCLADCRRVGLVREDDPVWTATQVDMPYAYVVYDHGRADKVARIKRWLADRDIVAAGRYGEWAYYNSDHAFLAGKAAADTARGRYAVRSSVSAGATAGESAA
jgi:UDP-galactopyranose mutase